MKKILIMALIATIGNAYAQNDSTSVFIGSSLGKLNTIVSPGNQNREWTQADTYLIPATTVNNTTTNNTYTTTTTTGGTCTNTTMAITGYTPASYSQNYYFNGCMPTGSATIPPTGSIQVYENGGSCETQYKWQIPVWQSVCK